MQTYILSNFISDFINKEKQILHSNILFIPNPSVTNNWGGGGDLYSYWVYSIQKCFVNQMLYNMLPRLLIAKINMLYLKIRSSWLTLSIRPSILQCKMFFCFLKFLNFKGCTQTTKQNPGMFVLYFFDCIPHCNSKNGIEIQQF